MANIPIEKQLLAVNPIERIEHKIAQGEAIPGGELLDAIEQSQGHTLDDRARDVVRRFSVSPVKRRGRPNNCKGPAVDCELLAASPGVEHEDIRGHVSHLPNDIELARPIEACARVIYFIEFRTVRTVDLPDRM